MSVPSFIGLEAKALDAVAELVIGNVKVVDVEAGEVRPADVVIRDGRIAAVLPPGQGEGPKRLEGRDRYLAPGFMNAHVHSESALVTLTEWARLILAKGTTSVFINPHEIANVLGLAGVELLLQQARSLPLRVFVIAPCEVPTAPGLETSGASFDVAELEQMATWPQVIAAGEFTGRTILSGNERQLRLLEAARRLGLRTDGHLTGLSLEEYALAKRIGIDSNHETVEVEDAAAQAAAGLTVMIREGSSARNIGLVAAVRQSDDDRRYCFCTDDKDPAIIAEQGDLDWSVNQAIQRGIPPVQALRMATLNCANHYGLDRLGRISPGAEADLLLFSDLEQVRPEVVICRGEVVAEEGRLTRDLPTEVWPAWARQTVHLADLRPEDLALAATESVVTARVIQVVPDQIVTRWVTEQLPVREGVVQPDLERDILKLAVVERHRASGRCQNGFIRGFGLRRGALAGSVAHDHHHLVGVGASEQELCVAFRALERLGGGIVAVDGEQVIASLPLPIAGLMSDAPLATVQAQVEAVETAAHSLGCRLPRALGILPFISLPTVPEAGITDLGLVDVLRGQLCSPLV